ncbi:hypothetical protein L1887_05253 [Cichorium endivia]|nr:hypothetical protein L1887_05253 [Cichorium endivia]
MISVETLNPNPSLPSPISVADALISSPFLHLLHRAIPFIHLRTPSLRHCVYASTSFSMNRGHRSNKLKASFKAMYDEDKAASASAITLAVNTYDVKIRAFIDVPIKESLI